MRQGAYARKRRVTFDRPGDVHELTFSCSGGLPLLGGDRSRGWFVDSLAAARDRLGFRLWAYVVMPTHAHLLVYPNGVTIDSILKSVKQPVARKAMATLRAEQPEWLERLRVTRPGGRVEYRFWQQGGGFDRNMVVCGAVRTSIRYIHGNPVRAGLVATEADWPWSSAGWYARREDALIAMDELPFLW